MPKNELELISNTFGIFI